MNVHLEGQEGWTAEELTEINQPGRLRPPPEPERPLLERAQPLLDLGVKLDRAAELLHVSVEELLRAVPRVHARVLLPPSAVYTLSPAQRLRREDW